MIERRKILNLNQIQIELISGVNKSRVGAYFFEDGLFSKNPTYTDTNYSARIIIDRNPNILSDESSKNTLRQLNIDPDNI